MATTTNKLIASTYNYGIARPSIFTTFFQWCTAQNENRLLWLDIIITVHGCVLTPVTAMAVYFGGNSLPLFMMTFIAMGIALVINLTALPTKYALPMFLLSVFTDLGIVVSSLIMASQ